MGQVHHRSTVAAPVGLAFDIVDDYRHVPDWMFGVSRFAPVGEQTQGLGARFDTSMDLGPKTLNSKVEIVTWEHGRIIELESYDGFAANTTWKFADLGDEGTEIDVTFGYTLPGGLAGKALGIVIEPLLGTAIRQTDNDLRKRILSMA